MPVFPTDYTLLHKIESDYTKVSGSSNLTNYPTLLTEDNFLAAVFTATQGKELYTNFLGSKSTLAAYYRFSSGADTTDTSGNSNTLTHVNTPTNVTGMFGNGEDYESSSSQKSTAADSTSLSITGALSIISRVKFESLPSSGNAMVIAGKYLDTSNQRSYILRLTNNGGTYQLQFTYSTDGTYQVANDKTVDWTPVVATWYTVGISLSVSGTPSLKFSVNGAQVGTTQSPTGTSIYNSTALLYIGALQYSAGDTWFFDGILDDIGIFAEALSDLEMKSAHTGGADLIFTTDEAGTRVIPHEVVNWDIVNSLAEVHSQIPTLSYTATTTIYVWGDNATASPVGRELYTFNNLINDANLQGYWRLESDGVDSGPNSNDLIGSGTPTHVPAMFGNGVDLELSSSQYYSISDASQTGLGITGDISIRAIIKLEQLPSTVGVSFIIISKDAVVAGTPGKRPYFFDIDSTTNKLRCSYEDGSANRTRATCDLAFNAGDLGKLIDIAVTVDVSTSTISFYINGVLKTSTYSNTAATSIVDYATPFYIGASHNNGTPSNFFDGIIDDVAVLDRILTPQEVAGLYGSGAGVWDANYIGVWHLNGHYESSTSDVRSLTPTNSPVFAAGLSTGGESALDFESGSSQYAGNTNSAYNLISNYTVQSLFKLETVQNETLISGVVTDANSYGGLYNLRIGTDKLQGNTWASSGSFLDVTGATTLSADTLYTGAFTKNGTSDWKVFLNGAQDGSSTSSRTLSTTAKNGIRLGANEGSGGSSTPSGNFFDGLQDEVRISDIVRSADWLLTEYYNQSDPSTFWSAISTSTEAIGSIASQVDFLSTLEDTGTVAGSADFNSQVSALGTIGNLTLLEDATLSPTTGGNVDLGESIIPRTAIYKWILYDRATARNLADITDARNKSFTTYLNAGGNASFTFNMTHPLATATNLALGQVELHIYRNDVKIWGGELNAQDGSLTPDSEDITVHARSYLTLLADRYTGASRTFTGVDSGLIAWTLIDESQQETGGDFGFTQGTITTSVVRSRLYEYKNILEALQQLSEVSSGFDFEITPEKVFNVYYPEKGSDVSQSEELLWGRNIQELSFTKDFTEPVNQAIVLGAGEGASMNFTTRTDTTARSLYQLRQRIINYKDVENLTTLNDKGDRVLVESKDPRMNINVVQIGGRGILAFSRVNLGDYIRVKVDHGFFTIDDNYRVRGFEVDLDDDGTEKVTYALAKVPKIERTLYQDLKTLNEQITILGASVQTIWGTNVLQVAPTIGSPSGDARLVLDGENKRILINDGSNDRILLGYQSGGF